MVELREKLHIIRSHMVLHIDHATNAPPLPPLPPSLLPEEIHPAVRELAKTLAQEMPNILHHRRRHAKKTDLRRTGGASLPRATAKSSMN